MIKMKHDIQGSILDIGGGGEGVISSIYGKDVTAIDYRKDELDELQYDSLKLVMDASSMSFQDTSFQNVTSFYSLMFVDKKRHVQVIKECYRVLKIGGSFYIWDTEIKSKTDEENPFLVDLDIDANGKKITTTFGIIKPNAEQCNNYFIQLCSNQGFELVSNDIEGQHFMQHWVK